MFLTHLRTAPARASELSPTASGVSGPLGIGLRARRAPRIGCGSRDQMGTKSDPYDRAAIKIRLFPAAPPCASRDAKKTVKPRSRLWCGRCWNRWAEKSGRSSLGFSISSPLLDDPMKLGHAASPAWAAEVIQHRVGFDSPCLDAGGPRLNRQARVEVLRRALVDSR
jgi:hypothetical protein